MRHLRLLAAVACAAVASAVAGPLMAQGRDLSKVEIRTERLAPGVAVLFGEGGNIGVSFGPDGPVLIDDQYAPLAPKIAAAVRALDPAPVRFVVNTHWHPDHTGGNEQWGEAGAVIIAHDNVRQRLSVEQVRAMTGARVPASPPGALPVVTFDDGVTLHLNGDTLTVVHASNGHTDGDSIVKWRKANVVHTGDLFVTNSLPFIDRSSGGSLQGLIAGADKILRLSDANTRVVPGHGAVSTRADVERFRAMLIDVRDKVAAGIASGRTLEQIEAAGPATRYEVRGGFIDAKSFTRAVYDSLKSPPAGRSMPHGHKH